MKKRQILLLVCLIVGTVFLLSAAWTFGLEHMVLAWWDLAPIAEDTEGRWEFVVVSVAAAMLAVTVPAGLLMRLSGQTARAIETLGQSEERYRTLVEMSPTAILVHRDFRILYANRAAAALVMVDHPWALVGENLLRFVHPDSRDALRARARAVSEGQETLPFAETRLIRADGTEVDVASSSSPIIHDGRAAIQTVVRDISERKRSENMLRTVAEGVSGAVGERFFHSLVHYLAETLDADVAFVGRLRGARIETLAHYADGHRADNFEFDLAGTPCAEVVGQQTRVFADRLGDRFPADRRFDGQGLCSYVGTPLFDSAGRPLGVLAVLGRKRLADAREETTASLLRIFAVRAAAEIARSQAEDALRASEARFRSVAQSAADAIVSVDRDGRITFWNRAAEVTFGFGEDEALGRPLDLIIPPHHRQGHAQGVLHAAAAGGEPHMGQPLEVQGMHKSGRVFPVELSLSHWTAAGERFFSAIIRDISERKRAEAQTAKATRALRALSAGNHALVHAATESDLLANVCRIIVETGGYRLAWVGFADATAGTVVRPVASYGENDGHLERLERTWADLETGQGPTATALATGKACIAQNLAEEVAFEPWRVEATGRGFASVIALALLRGGRAFGTLTIYAPEPDAFDEDEIRLLSDLANNLSYGIWALRDLSERRRAEAELRKLSRAVEQSPAAVVITDLSGVIEYVNPRFTAITGYSAAEVIGCNPRILKPDDDATDFSDLWQTIREGREWRGEFRNRRKDGTVYWESALISPVRDGEGHITHYLAIKEDISERKRTEAALLEAKEIAELANRAKTEFLANMSHELRTPLNSVIGFSDILAGEVFGPMGKPEYLEYARDINTSGKHLLDLINDILDISRIEVGGMNLQEARVDVGRVVNGCYRLVKERAQIHALALHLDLPDGLPALLADERRLKQILLNLLANAIKFTPDGGQVSLAARVDEDGRFVFTVADNGIGIRPEDIDLVMSTFGQADSSLARKYEGAGLGLPLSKRLAELHGAALALDSAPSRGTTVTVTFPAERTVKVS